MKTQTHNELSQFVPTTDGYIPRKLGKLTDVGILETAYSQKPLKDLVLVEGETGAGKTALARHFCYVKKLPYARINLHGGTTPDELIGHFIPDSNGGFKWQDGLLTTFVRKGGVVVLDEANFCPPEILGALHSLTDDERKLTLVANDSEVIHAHKDFFLIATINPDYEGTRPLNEAFRDRFKVVLFFDYDINVEKKLISDDKLRKLASKLRIMKTKGEIVTPVSTRSLIQFEQNSKLYGHELALDFFLNKFKSFEREPIKNVLDLLSTIDVDSNSQEGVN